MRVCKQGFEVLDSHNIFTKSFLKAIDEYFLCLRRWDCKYRELIFKTEIMDFFIFCQEKPFSELFSKILQELAREFLILRNPTK